MATQQKVIFWDDAAVLVKYDAPDKRDDSVVLARVQDAIKTWFMNTPEGSGILRGAVREVHASRPHAGCRGPVLADLLGGGWDRGIRARQRLNRNYIAKGGLAHVGH